MNNGIYNSKKDYRYNVLIYIIHNNYTLVDACEDKTVICILFF